MFRTSMTLDRRQRVMTSVAGVVLATVIGGVLALGYGVMRPLTRPPMSATRKASWSLAAKLTSR